MTPEAGMLSCTVRWADGPEQEKTEGFRLAGGLIVHVEAERCRIAPEDVRGLIFAGRPESKTFGFLPLRSSHLAVLMLAFARTYRTIAPVMGERVRRTGGIVTSSVTIEGHAALNPAGRAVVIHLRAGSWIIPLVSFQRVARGEAASAPLFPLVEVDLHE